MTSTTQRYSATALQRYSALASQSASTVEKITDLWTQGSQRLSDNMLPARRRSTWSR